MKANVYLHPVIKGPSYRSLAIFPKEELNIILLGTVNVEPTSDELKSRSQSNELPIPGDVLMVNLGGNNFTKMKIV